MDKGKKILSDVTVWNKYSRFLQDKERRETFDEVIDRYQDMMNDKYPVLKDKTNEYIKFVRSRKVLPSMRGLQFAGKAIEKNESRVYNCAFLPIDDYRAFSETMFLLLGGTGVGYSVQPRHINQLPGIKKPLTSQKFIIEDSIEGWADSIKYLMKAYFGLRKHKPRFDFSAIRQKGERLITAGGKAPGPEPLKRCLMQIELILERRVSTGRLTSLDCHDIQCHIADAVLSGGIRRAAMISLFDKDDIDMITCKSGSWWELNPQRGRANNSAVLDRKTTTKKEFNKIWSLIKASGSGEPGIYWTNNLDWGTNPCCEIALKPFSFCNLSEIDASSVENQFHFEALVSAASHFGTMQAGFTDFHYLRPIWQQTTEEDALIGVGITGIASGNLNKLDLKKAAKVAININKQVSSILGINTASRITTVKPSGSTSLVVGSSSGIHAWHDKHYIRRVELNANDALVPYMKINHPELIQPLERRPGDYVLEIPQKAPKDAVLRGKETALQFLRRVHKFNKEWVQEGHNRGDNTNNVSATCSIKQNEWGKVGEWMWENKEDYNGMSVLPYDGGSYSQSPFETISEEKYEKLYKSLSEIDITKVVEFDDTTDLNQQVACAGGACEV